MTVNVDTYPLYYRILLHELAQTWSLEPADKGTRVTLTFDASLKLGVIGILIGKILTAAPHPGHPRRLRARARAVTTRTTVTKATTTDGSCQRKVSAGAAGRLGCPAGPTEGRP